MLRRFLKGSCLLLWLTASTLMAMAYHTQTVTEELEAREFGVDSNQKPIFGRDRFTGVLRPEVVENMTLGRRQALAGLGMGIAGLLMAVFILRREKKRGKSLRKTSSKKNRIIPITRGRSFSRSNSSMDSPR